MPHLGADSGGNQEAGGGCGSLHDAHASGRLVAGGANEPLLGKGEREKGKRGERRDSASQDAAGSRKGKGGFSDNVGRAPSTDRSDREQLRVFGGTPGRLFATPRPSHFTPVRTKRRALRTARVSLPPFLFESVHLSSSRIPGLRPF